MRLAQRSGGIVPLGFSGRFDTRDAIICLLGQKWPLSAKEVYSEIKKTHGISYQGVHKLLGQLVVEDFVTVKDRKYMLNMHWIRNLKKFSEVTERLYLKSTDMPYLEVGTGSSVEKKCIPSRKRGRRKGTQAYKIQ